MGNAYNLKKKNPENLNRTILKESDLVAKCSKESFCLLRDREVYRIEEDISNIFKKYNNQEEIKLKHIYSLCDHCKIKYSSEFESCKRCDEYDTKEFIPLGVVKEAYNFMNKGK